jgi:hypothetical protein
MKRTKTNSYKQRATNLLVCSSMAKEKLSLTVSAGISKRGSQLRHLWWAPKSYCAERGGGEKMWIWYIKVSLDEHFKRSIFYNFDLILIK